MSFSEITPLPRPGNKTALTGVVTIRKAGTQTVFAVSHDVAELSGLHKAGKVKLLIDQQNGKARLVASDNDVGFRFKRINGYGKQYNVGLTTREGWSKRCPAPAHQTAHVQWGVVDFDLPAWFFDHSAE